MGMQTRISIAAIVALLPVAAFAQLPAYEPTLGQSGIDLGAMDTNVSPCSNFYQYACGTWRAKNPIPPDRARWGRSDELVENNLKIERGILEKAAQSSTARSALDQKIGDFYAACMNEPAIERLGIAPIGPELDQIDGLRSKEQLASVLAKLGAAGINGMFQFSADADRMDASRSIASIDQGGISLPDRDYYIKTDAASIDIRTRYQQHVARVFGLLAKARNAGWDSNARAVAVLKFETALAQNSMDRATRRNPDTRNHPMTVKDLPGLTPDFQWNVFFSGEAAPAFQKVNVGNPEFFRKLADLLNQTSLDDLKSYLTWRALLDNARAMPKAFVDENFDFFGRTLTGAKEIQPRWKRCVEETDSALGEALGQKYVEVAFSGPARARALELVHEIESSMEQDIKTAPWMTEATKQQALTKLAAVSNKIGYPDKWRDYSSVAIKPDDFFGNQLRASAFKVRRDLNKIGKPVDKSEWFMTPPTVNAYYNPPENNINFPAGILQPPLYNPKADDALNYGAIGVVVGHELTHGFDDAGRRYDGSGNLRDWWTPEDAANFTERADCIVNEYNGFSPVDGVKLNGRLTLGENAADNGGIQLAYAALMHDLANRVLPKTADGFTQEQLFFLGYAQIWCQNTTDAESRRRAIVDSHSPGEFRVNGVVQNMPQFQQAYSCKLGDAMVAPKACRVW
jgi:endothelin-converting enzyme/putative endopeptidase